jgi:plasmid stabilization system protein ParE
VTSIVYLRPAAQADLTEAADWYERQRAGLGAQFLEEVVRTLAHIEANPWGYPKVIDDVRRVRENPGQRGIFSNI